MKDIVVLGMLFENPKIIWFHAIVDLTVHVVFNSLWRHDGYSSQYACSYDVSIYMVKATSNICK